MYHDRITSKQDYWFYDLFFKLTYNKHFNIKMFNIFKYLSAATNK